MVVELGVDRNHCLVITDLFHLLGSDHVDAIIEAYPDIEKDLHILY